MVKSFSVIILIIFFSFINLSYCVLDSRSLALGGTFLAIGEDIAAINYNPAGIYTEKKPGYKESKIFDITLTGDMITFFNTAVAISTTASEILNIQKNQGYMDIKGIQMFNSMMHTVEDISNSQELGILTETSLGSIMLYTGMPALSLTPKIYFGAEPWIDVEFLNSSGLKISTGTLYIIDFSGIPASTDTPSAELIGARDNFLNMVTALVNGGAVTGGLTNEQIANALVNQAKNDGLSDNEIIFISSDTNTILPLFESMYAVFTSTYPEAFLDYPLGFVIKDLNIIEITVGYASPIKELSGTFFEDIIFGINLKYMFGETIYKRLSIAELNYAQKSGYNPIKSDNRQITDAIGVDIGMLIDKKDELNTKFAFSATNINTPKFKPPPSAVSDNVKYELPPSAKIGIAFWPTESITLAMDIDLIRKPTFIYNYYTQMLSAGAEFVVLDKIPDYNITLRCGLRKNLASPSDNILYSIGLGTTFLSVTVDLALAYSPVGAPYNQVPEYISKYFKSINLGYVPENWEFAFGLSFKWREKSY